MATADLPCAPRKIAVLNAKALGDFIVVLPALRAIKETYPDAELILLGRAWVKEFLSGRATPVDRVVSVPVLAGINNPIEKKSCSSALVRSAQAEQFYKAMQAEKLDLAIHMQGDGKFANPFINRLGARLTAGMRNEAAEPIDRFIPYVHYQSEIFRNLEIAGLVGARTTQFEPHFEVTKADEQETVLVREIVRGKPYAVLHAGADDIRRLWPAVKFADVADSLVERGYEVVLTGTSREKEIVKNVAQAMEHTAIPCTSISLGGLAALLSKSALVISNDTGPLHLARAVGARTVGIYWAPNVLNWGPLSRNSHRVAISWELECPQCGVKPVSPWPFYPLAPHCDHPYSFVESVSVAEVLTLALELLPPQNVWT